MRTPKYWLLDANHQPYPVDLMTWAKWFEHASHEARTVQRTEQQGVTISTVFLGLDHSFRPGGPPLLFETMIFEGPHDQYQERYSTWDEAMVGHEKAVQMALQTPGKP